MQRLGALFHAAARCPSGGKQIETPGGLHANGQPQLLVRSQELDAADFLKIQADGVVGELEGRGQLLDVELFLAGYRDSSRFRLESRPGLPSGASFRDRQWLVGGGVEWRPWRLLGLGVEAGAVVDRRLSIRARGEGTLDEANADLSPYVGVRLELRP